MVVIVVLRPSNESIKGSIDTRRALSSDLDKVDRQPDDSFKAIINGAALDQTNFRQREPLLLYIDMYMKPALSGYMPMKMCTARGGAEIHGKRATGGIILKKNKNTENQGLCFAHRGIRERQREKKDGLALVSKRRVILVCFVENYSDVVLASIFPIDMGRKGEG